MLIIAHRGASYDAPENTLAAARLAWTQGADAVEVDVHLTRDGKLAVIHDADTQRTAGRPGEVARLTLAELQQCDAGSWKDARFAAERIPELHEVLAEVPKGRRVFVELKSDSTAVLALQGCLAEVGRKRGLRATQVTVIAFDLAVAGVAKRALPECDVCWLADCGTEAPRPTLLEVARDARAAELDGIDIASGWSLDAETVQHVQAGGFKLYVWTVDDPVLAQRLLDVGADGITTNRPGWLREQLMAGRSRSK